MSAITKLLLRDISDLDTVFCGFLFGCLCHVMQAITECGSLNLSCVLAYQV